MPAAEPSRQTLIFDADDTLWENNVYFERAIDDFIDWLDHSSLSAAEVRVTLDEIQRANIRLHGYGVEMFGRSLREAWQRLRSRDVADDDLPTIMAFAERILRQPIELMPGVAETLAALAPRHDLMLLTKGHAAEQRLKVERSGIADRFAETVIVPEKDASVYRSTVERLGAVLETTWMIGNSPRSDVNPALAAGLNAVLIPHPLTWRLEHEEVAAPAAPDRLLVVERFPDLLPHFLPCSEFRNG